MDLLKNNLFKVLPLIVKMPAGNNQGTVTDAMITWADLTPTILDIAGVLDSELQYRKRQVTHGL